MRWIVVVVVVVLAVGVLALAFGGGEDALLLDSEVAACRELATSEWEAFHNGFLRDPDRAAVLSAYQSAAVYAIEACS